MNKRVLSVILVAVLVSGLLCACSDKKEVVTQNNEYTYWTSLPSATSQTLASYNDMLMYQEIEKATGTKVNFIHPASGSTGTEAFQILLSSGDYPDMIEYRWDSYAGGPDCAIEDGVILALNDYLKDYAPNYYNYMEGEKAKENDYIYKAQSITYNGNYYGFKNLNMGTYRKFSGLYLRRDMIEEWGVNVPETIDDWTELLKTAKEKGCKVPLTGGSALFGITGSEMFNTAWNVGKDWYIEDDKVKYGPFENAYKDYIQQMAQWMAEGLVDQDYITNDSASVNANMTNGASVASFGAVGGGLGKLLPAMEGKDPDYDLVACPYPVLKAGDTTRIADVQYESAEPAIAVSVQCGVENEERYKEAITWCDYIYSDEGIILKSFGVEGETYTIEKDENGVEHYIYTDKIMDHEKIGAHSVEAALWHFFRPANSPGFNQHPDYLKGFYPYECQNEALEVWNQNIEETRKSMIPPLTYTDEEVVKKANIEASWNENIDAAVSNFILGKISMDEFVAEMEKAKKGGFDELVKIQQSAYERYIQAK